MKTQTAFDNQFMADHPNIKIQAENVPDDWLTKLLAETASGTEPDVQYCQFAQARKLIYDGLFINEQPYMNQNPEFSLDQFTPASIPTYRYKGNMHIIPYDTGPELIFYNIDLFNKAGVPLPNPNWTLADMLDTAQKLTRGTGVDQTWGYTGSAGDFGRAANTNYTMPFGGRFLDKDEVTFLGNTPEAEAGYQWWADLVLKAKVIPTSAEAKTLTGGAFQSGRTAMLFGGSWNAATYYYQLKFQYAVMAFPAGPKAHSTDAVGSGYGITKDSKHVDEAWVYQSSYLGEKGAEFMWADSGSGSMARKATWPAYLKSPLAPKGAQLVYDALTTYADGADVVQSPNAPAIASAANKTWSQVLAGTMSVRDALTSIGAQIAPLLEKNKPYVGLFG
jgi:multiple sugar transport system substrate-binding protein